MCVNSTLCCKVLWQGWHHTNKAHPMGSSGFLRAGGRGAIRSSSGPVCIQTCILCLVAVRRRSKNWVFNWEGVGQGICRTPGSWQEAGADYGTQETHNALAQGLALRACGLLGG